MGHGCSPQNVFDRLSPVVEKNPSWASLNAIAHERFRQHSLEPPGTIPQQYVLTLTSAGHHILANGGLMVAPIRNLQYVSPSSKRAKTETLSLRLDPKTKFMLDFLARVQGQSITTVVERAVHQVAGRVSVAPFDESDKTWATFWDASEGVRTLKLIADPHYPTNYDEDELLSFAKVHWPFFYQSEKAITPRQSYVDLLWPKIDFYLDLWRTVRQENYWAAGEAMRADLLAAKIAAPDWPVVKSAPRVQPRESFSADLDDEIPF